VPLFVGEFEQTIDSKKRLSIPAALRDGLEEDDFAGAFYLVLGTDGLLWLYPDKYYRRLVATIKRSPLPAKGARGLEMLFAMARVVKPDAQGRVVLPEKSLQRSRITDSVTLVGSGDHIVMWPAEEWERTTDEMLPTYAQMLTEAAARLQNEQTELR